MDCSPLGSSVHGDSPGKITGVGCHALLQGVFLAQGSNPGLLLCRRILYHLSHCCCCCCRCQVASVVSDSVQPHRRQPTRLPRPWDSPGKITGVGGHALLQGIFPTQGLNTGLLHCRQTFYHLSYREYLMYMQSTLFEMPGWMRHKLESRLLGEISITSYMQMTPPLWQKVKKN